MKKFVSYKVQLILAAIPFIGIFFAVMISAFNIKYIKSTWYGFFYFLIWVLPSALLFWLASLVIRFLILPLEEYWLIALVSTIFIFFLLAGLAYLAILIEKVFISKFCRQGETKEEVDQEQTEVCHEDDNCGDATLEQASRRENETE